MKQLIEGQNAKVFLLSSICKENEFEQLSKYIKLDDDKLFVITTEQNPINKISVLRDEVVHIDIGNKILLHDEKLKLLHRLLLEGNIKSIHIIESEMAYEIMKYYHKTFSGIEINISLFENKNNKNHIGWEMVKYPEILDVAKNIFTDSLEYKNQITDVFGVEENTIFLSTIRKCTLKQANILNNNGS